MKAKIGLHVNGLFPGIDEWVRQAQPAVLVSLDHSRDHWQQLRATSPNSYIIGRLVDFDDGDPRFYPTFDSDTPATSTQKAQAFFDHLRPVLEQMRGVYDAWVGINEPVCKSDLHARNLSAWHVRWGDLMRSIQVVSVAYTFSQGVPESYHWPLLTEGLSHCNLLGLHEYWYPTLKSPGMIPYHVLRYRAALENLPATARRKVVVTECGVDAGAANLPTAGWRKVISEAEYLADLKSYDAELQKDPYVIGAMVFCAGAGWPSWDISGAGSIPTWIGSTGAAAPVQVNLPAQMGGGNGSDGGGNKLVEQAALAAGANKFGIPLNPQAALAKYALDHKLGIPLTDEYEFAAQGTTYVGQVWSKAVVFCKKGDWNDIQLLQ